MPDPRRLDPVTHCFGLDCSNLDFEVTLDPRRGVRVLATQDLDGRAWVRVTITRSLEGWEIRASPGRPTKDEFAIKLTVPPHGAPMLQYSGVSPAALLYDDDAGDFED